MRNQSVQHILLVGGGHAMLHTLRHIRKKVPPTIHISLINDHPFLYYSGMVPEYLGGVYREEEIRIDLKRWCELFGINWIQGKVTTLNAAERWVELEDTRQIQADILAFDVGSVTPVSELNRGMMVTKPLHRITHLLSTLQQMTATRTFQPLAIVGAGAAGVEIALNLAHRLQKEGLSEHIPIQIFEEKDRVLSRFDQKLSESAHTALMHAGVQIYLNTKPLPIGPHQMKMNNTTQEYGAVLWATGTVAPAFFLNSGLSTHPNGFVYTDHYLIAKNYPNILVAGDSALVEGYETIERIGVHAVKQGPIVLATLQALIFGKKPSKPFKPYAISPIIISSGTDQAWWVTSSFWFKHKWALGLKHYVDRTWINPWLEIPYQHRALYDYVSASR